MRKLAILCALAGTLASVQAAQAQGYYGRPPGRPGYGPPPGYGPGWYGMAGCGLGSLIFGPIDTPGAQILAATTNSTLGSQTFGITSGTSNCVSGGVVRAEREQDAFAEVNFRDLKRDMAAGGGEFLSAFATLLGCEPATRPTLARMTQSRYESIFPSDSTTPMELVAHVKAEITSDPSLAGRCSDERAMARAGGNLGVAAPPPPPRDLAMTASRRQSTSHK